MRFARLETFVQHGAGSPMIARSSSTTGRSTAVTAVIAPPPSADAPRFPPTSIPADSATSSMMSRTSMPASRPASASGRSDHTQALTSMSTSSSGACSIRRRLISAVSSGFSIGSPPPPPEQYDHCVTWSTSLNVRPGIARRISRGALWMPLRLLRRHGSWYVTVRSIGFVELEAAVADEFREQLDDLHDLDVEVVAEVRSGSPR